jgi:hypothetical protein
LEYGALVRLPPVLDERQWEIGEQALGPTEVFGVRGLA